MRITISGPPGSGKTTAARGVAEKLGLELILTGKFFRNMAKDRNMSLSEFGELALTDPSIDRELDDRVISSFCEGTLLEGRLAGVMANINDIPAYKVFINASIETRAIRIGKREGQDPKSLEESINERNTLENSRYEKIYGLNPCNIEVYDLVMMTDDMGLQEVIDEIVSFIEKWESGQ